MSIIKNTLSSLTPGTAIQITKSNGQVVHGIIENNDQNESLSIRVSMSEIVTYSSIASIELFNISSAVNLENKIDSNKKEIAPERKMSYDNLPSVNISVTEDELLEYWIDEDDLKKLYSEMNSSDRSIFLNAYDDIIDGIKDNNETKKAAALSSMITLSNKNGKTTDDAVNRFIATAAFIAEDYKSATEYFYYGNDIKSAYLTAFRSAYMLNGDISLYNLAAVFSAVYILYATQDTKIGEAAACLQEATIKCKDITGIKFLVDNVTSDTTKSYILEILKKINNKTKLNIVNYKFPLEFIDSIKLKYTNSNIYDEILKFENIKSQMQSTAVSSSNSENNNRLQQNTNFSDTTGEIIFYNFFNEKGQIKGLSGTIYEFDLKEVLDSKIYKKLQNFAKKAMLPTPIPVQFVLDTIGNKPVVYKINKYSAVSAQSTPKSSKPTEETKTNKTLTANQLFTNQQYDKAIILYEKLLDTDEFEKGVRGLIQCYLSLCNKDSQNEIEYKEKLKEIGDMYFDKLAVTVGNYEMLNQLYTKIGDYEKMLNIINTLLEICDGQNLGKISHYLYLKARCYKLLKDYETAAGQLLDFCDFVKKHKLKEKYDVLQNSVYLELADIYMELKLYDKSKYFLSLSAEVLKKVSLKEKLSELCPDNTNEDNTSDSLEQDNDDTDTVEKDEDIEEDNIADALNSYHDDDALDVLVKSDADIIQTISEFKSNQLYCMLTYLSAVSKMAKNSLCSRKSEFAEITVIDSLKTIDNVFSYAYSNPISTINYNMSELLFDFESAKEIIPEIINNLFISSSLRVIFNNNEAQSYEIDKIIQQLKNIAPCDITEISISLAELLYDFRTKTGYGIDLLADYNTKSPVIEQVINNALECKKFIAQRSSVYESQGQLRRARQFMFTDEESELHNALEAVCNNNINMLKAIKINISKLFMRSEDIFSISNIDIKKLDSFIDTSWNKARDVILAEKRHINRPHDRLKGSKRTNIISTIKRTLSCICDWVSVSEQATIAKDIYSQTEYNNIKPKILEVLSQLVQSCEKSIAANFDWGLHSLAYTAKELLSKIDGSYDFRTKKYMFTNFLLDNNILLNDDYIPDINSTFSDLSDFNILSRILCHSKNELPSFKERVEQISSDINNSNFRCAELILEYQNDMGNKEISEHQLFENFDEFIKSGSNKIKYIYEDFKSELELFENYGCISDVMGVKTAIKQRVDAWYRISILTCDFGFVAELINSYRNDISKKSETTAQKLTHQLDDLINNPEFDFGIYSKEQISAYIEDRNFTVAENILNCIRRHDTKNISDFTLEPYSVFSGFISEYSTIYRIVSDSKGTMSNSILKYFGKKNIEVILRQITNNASKDVKGGNALISNWPVRNPAGTDKIEKFINVIGFNNSTVIRDTTVVEDCYSVTRKKQFGKVNYPHPIAAFGSLSEEEGFRVLCLYGKFDATRLIDKFREINAVSKHTIVLLDFALNLEERRRLARKIKEEKSFSKAFIVIDRVLTFYLAKHYQANTISRTLMASTMPFAYYQPFCPTPNVPIPPELFTGRAEELRSIESPDGANLVYGGRQLGKSALLKMAEHNIDRNSNGDRAIVLDICDLNYEQAARFVSSKLVSNDILPEGCECDDWDTLAMYIEKRLKEDEPDKRINYFLLMLDEADKFIECSQAVNYRPITALKNILSKRFKFVLAGLHNLSKFNYEAVYYNNSVIAHLAPIVVRPFQRPEGTELLTHVLAYLGFRFKDDIVNLILAKTNYFPGLIHWYGQKLIEAMTNNDYAGYSEINTPYYEVTESHIKKVLSDPKFKDEINAKLRMTLHVNGNEDSPYHIIALILAYLYYNSPSEFGHTTDDILKVAESFDIRTITSLKSEQLTELLHEMWDLNIVSANKDCYIFSTDGFRELLGKKEDVENDLMKYIGGDS